MSKARNSIAEQASLRASETLANSPHTNSFPVTSTPNLLTRKLEALYRAQDTLPKLIEDASIPTQKLDQYYVDLSILANERGGSEKYSIEVEELFSPKDDQPEADKVLIVGGAGMGKSAFLQNITYKWAKGGQDALFTDQFDFVFKVKLKLLFSDWKAGYNSDDLEEPLKCFILYSLRSDPVYASLGKEYKIKQDEFFKAFDNSDPERILLLLDGYDEVASHMTSKKDPRVTQINKEIFEMKHIIMTSRPGAIDSLTENRFDRKVESSGLDNKSVDEYVRKYFDGQKQLLQAQITKFTSSPKYNAKKITNLNEALLNDLNKSADGDDREIYLQLNQIDKHKALKSNIEEIRQSINEYYDNSYNIIRDLFAANHYIKEVASTPINAAMICLICSDQEVLEKFRGAFNIGQLYQEVILWLGKRHIHKQDDSIKNISPERILSSRELSILKTVAHDQFKENELVFPGQVIDSSLSAVRQELNIDKIIKYGLTKIDNIGTAQDSDDLINQEHAFIHLSFQEYLTAQNLKELLLSEKEIEYREAATFIGQHRNEPRYLLTLKFLSGIATHDESPNLNLLVQRFWEAVTCNVDGFIELGMNTKVTLLMHLLEQAKVDGETDTRIPNIQKTKDLIDVVVCGDIQNFEKAIIESGYQRLPLKKYFLVMFWIGQDYSLA